MVVILAGMAVLYLRDKDQLEGYKEQQSVLKGNGSLETEVTLKQKENEVLKYKMRIAELEREVAQLKSKAVATAAAGAPDLPIEFTTTGTKGNKELEDLQVENTRLKDQNSLAYDENNIIMKAGIKQKEAEVRLAEHVKNARPMAKVGEVNIEHYIVVLEPIGQPNFNTKEGQKQKLLVRREGKVMLKMAVDSLDAQTGKYIAMAEPASSKADVEGIKQGDEVIMAPQEEEEAQQPAELEGGAPALPVFFDGQAAPSSGDKGGSSAPELPEPIK